MINTIAVKAARTYARAVRALTSKSRAALIPPAGAGSLGDAAMIAVANARLRQEGFAEIDFLMNEPWSAVPTFNRFLDGNSYFYQQSRRAQFSLLAESGRYSGAFMIGADVIDGVYNPGSVIRRLSYISEVASIGGEAAILGSSFSETPNSDCVAALRKLPLSVRINARDPISASRMIALLDRPIRSTADLAFLLEPDDQHPEARSSREWIAARQAAGDWVVAINANYLLNEKYAGFSDAFNALFAGLLGHDISLLLVPHDVRTDRSDSVLLKEAAAMTAPTIADRIRYLEPISPGVVKATLGYVDLVVTARMHVAILAMGAGRPAFSFGYQGKFEGMLRLLNLEDAELLVSPTDLIENPSRMVDLVLRQLRQTATVASTLEKTIPTMRNLAQLNFSKA